MDPLTIALIATAGVGALASAVSSKRAYSTQKGQWEQEFERANYEYEDTKRYNHVESLAARQFASDEALAQRDWEASQAALTREFNAAEAEKARAFQTSERLAQQAYNSPVELVKRYSDAGLNPSVMMGGQSAIASSTPSAVAASASVPTGSSASAPSPASIHQSSMPGISPLTPPIGVFPAMASGIGDGLTKFIAAQEQLAKADLTKAQKDRIYALLDGEVAGQQLANGLIQLNAQWLPKEKQALLNVYAKQIDVAASEINLNDAKVATEKSMQLLNDELAKYHGKNRVLLEEQIRNYGKTLELVNSQIAKNYAEANEANSSNRLNNANAVSQELQNAIDKMLDKNGLRYNAHSMNLIESAARSAVESNLHETGVTYKQAKTELKYTEHLVTQMRQAAERGDMESWKYYVDRLIPIMGESGAALGQALILRKGGPIPIKGFGH